MKGFVYVSPLSIINHTVPIFSAEVEPYRFHINGCKVYYVNGNKRIFLLDSLPWEKIFCGPCTRIFQRANVGPLLFTPISHLEYVFQ